jgi:NHLM bacteriocin system ABC transporter ATP-binding protein
MSREELLQIAAHHTCRGNAPVLLEDSQTVYWVTEGEVEVFLLDSSGQRWPWLNLAPGHWILGQSPQPQFHLAAYACSSEGSQIACLPMMHLEKSASIFLQSIEHNIHQYGRLFGPIAPKNTRALRAGLSDTLVFENDRCNAESGIIWVRPKDGQLRFLEADGPLLEAGWFPLYRSLWVLAPQRLHLETCTTEEVAAQGGWLGGIRLLQSQAFLAACRQSEIRRQALSEAVAHRQLANQNALSGGLACLARILPGAEVADPETGDEGLDLQALCRNLEMAFGCPFPAKVEAGLPLPQALARSARCRWRNVLLREGWWKADAGPMMVFWNEQFGVVYRKGEDYWFLDSRPGAPRKVNASLAQELAPQAFVFYPPFPRRHLGLSSLGWMCLQLGQRQIAVLLLMALLSALLALFTPLATGLLIGTVLPSGLESELGQLILALLVASLGGNLFGLVRSLTQLRLEGRLDAHLQAALFDRLLELPAPFYRKYSLGDLANRTMGFNSLRQALSGAVLSSFLSALFSSFSLVMLFYYSWKLAIVAIVAVVFQCLALFLGSVIQLRYQRVQLNLAGQLAGQVAQFLAGISKLRVAGAEVRAFYQWSQLFAKYRQSVYNLRISNLVLTGLQAFLALLTQAVVLGFTAHYGYTKAISAASLMSFFSALGQFSSGLSSLTGSLTSLLSVGPILERARPILETVPEVEPDMPVAAPLKGLVEVKGAWFRFSEESNWVLQDVSIQANPGEFIAIVGPSGAGKSSLLRLLLGFEQAQRGSVFYDGQNLMRVDRVSLRRQLGVVLQDARLMPGNILSNIIGSALLTEEDAMAALRLAGLEEEVMQLPMQLHTVVTDGGGGLSGGQRQRLMIARAIVAKPRVLIFDEATSALDAKTQEDVSNSLAQLQATRIVVAHRLSTIRRADRIYVLNNHQIIQVGNYEELSTQPGFFAEFARRQLA